MYTEIWCTTSTLRSDLPPKEISQIITRRNQMMQRLIMALVLREDDKLAAERMIDDLMREYGRPEVTRMLGRLLENLSRPDDPEAEAAQLYATYVTTWRRFGSDQPLLSAEEHQRLLNERDELPGKPMLKQQERTDEEQARLNVLSNQILAEPHLWDKDDLCPPDTPARGSQTRSVHLSHAGAHARPISVGSRSSLDSGSTHNGRVRARRSAPAAPR